jgi:hypothetical protein
MGELRNRKRALFGNIDRNNHRIIPSPARRPT